LSTQPQDFSGAELAKLYQERFSVEELTGKRHLWEALYEGFLRQYVRSSDTVLDLGAGSCEFINACHAETKIAVDLNPETKLWARDARVVLAPSDDMAEVDDGSVDIVFTSNFFEHLPNKRALLDTLKECGPGAALRRPAARPHAQPALRRRALLGLFRPPFAADARQPRRRPENSRLCRRPGDPPLSAIHG
jgi:hypothetical protein